MNGLINYLKNDLWAKNEKKKYFNFQKIFKILFNLILIKYILLFLVLLRVYMTNSSSFYFIWQKNQY
jgi:hypothetical protein